MRSSSVIAIVTHVLATLATLALVMLAACGPLPRPFQPEDKIARIETSAGPYASGLVVKPVVDSPLQARVPLVDALTKAFDKNGVPATSSTANRNGLWLESQAFEEQVRAGRALIAIEWRVISGADGFELGRYTSRHRVGHQAWVIGAPKEIDAVAAKAARELTAFLRDEPARDVAPAVADRRPAVFFKVEGKPPGDGATALPVAFRSAVLGEGIDVAARPEEAVMLVSVRVTKVAQYRSQDRIAIEWTFRDPASGRERRIKQRNQVESGRLDRAWGDIAYDVVNAMREVVIKAVRSLPARSAARRPAGRAPTLGAARRGGKR